MGTLIYKTSVAQQNGVTPNVWLKVTFNTRQLGSSGISGVDTLGFYNKWVNLTSNDAVITDDGDYDFFGRVRCTKMKESEACYLRSILKRTDTGSLALTFQGGGVARLSSTKLASYANVGDPTNPADSWYNTNTLTVSGATDPAYNVTGNIIAFDPNGAWVEYSGIVGTPGADTASSATIEVGIEISELCNGNRSVFNALEYDHPHVVRELQNLFENDKIWLEFWHDNTLNAIDLVWGKADCYMIFRRDK